MVRIHQGALSYRKASQSNTTRQLQQAQILQEWISRWGLEPRDVRWIADDACWNRTGHALTIGDELRQGGIPFQRAGKSQMTEEAGLARLRTMLWATDRDESQPWIKASRRCRAFWELTPLLARDSKKRELLEADQPKVRKQNNTLCNRSKVFLLIQLDQILASLWVI